MCANCAERLGFDLGFGCATNTSVAADRYAILATRIGISASDWRTWTEPSDDLYWKLERWRGRRASLHTGPETP